MPEAYSILMDKIGAVSVVAASLVVIVGAEVVLPQQVSTEDLQERIWELRRQTRYAEAADIAKELLDLKKGDAETKLWEVADAERLVSTLEHVVGLPNGARREIALADSLADAFLGSWERGQFSEARVALEQELRIRRKLLGEQHTEVAQNLNDFAALLYAEGDYAGAEKIFREALAMRRNLLGDDHPEIAGTLNNLAFLLQLQGDYVGAEPLYWEALGIYKRALGDEDPLVATALANLGTLFEDWGDYESAEPLLRQALVMRRDLLGEEHPDFAMSLNNLALLLQAEGNYAAAEPLYRRALAINRKYFREKHPYVASALNNLAGVLRGQGDYVAAEQLFRESLELRREIFGEEHPDVAGSLNNVAGALRARGDKAGAESLYRESLAMLKRLLGEEHPQVALGLNNLGNLRRERGGYAEAETLFRESLAISRRMLGNEHRNVGLGLNNLALLLADEGQYNEAGTLFSDALGIWKNMLGEDHPLVVEALSNLGGVLLAQGDYTTAETVLEEAASAYDAARLRVGTGLERVAFLPSPYPRLAAARLGLGHADKAWLSAEKALGRALADLLLNADARDLNHTEAASEDSLRRALGDLEREMAAFRSASDRDSSTYASGMLDEARNRLLVAEAGWSSFQREMAKKYPVTEGQSFPLERVQAALGSESAVIGWLDVEVKKGQHDSWGYVIRSSGPVCWARLGHGSEKEGETSPHDRARAFRETLAVLGFLGLDAARDARDLYAQRIRPLLGALEGVGELTVIPSGAMVGVPIEALVDIEGIFLADRYAVSYIPSATIYTWLSERACESEGTARALLIGDPPFTEAHAVAMEHEEMVLASTEVIRDASVLRAALAGNDCALTCLPRLLGTREEISTVAELYQEAVVLKGPDASEQEVVRLAEEATLLDFETIHLATHALVDDERPDRSALVLSLVNLPDPLEAAMAGTRIYDGLVTAKEILREWHLNADLVTLSACETGLGKEVLGEGYVGFAHTFLQAGARSLLVSLWPVEDEATSLLMRRFYENWRGKYADDRSIGRARPMSKAKALQEAKHWLRTYEDEYGRRPFEHPYFWSAFILIGDRG